MASEIVNPACLPACELDLAGRFSPYFTTYLTFGHKISSLTKKEAMITAETATNFMIFAFAKGKFENHKKKSRDDLKSMSLKYNGDLHSYDLK